MTLTVNIQKHGVLVKTFSIFFLFHSQVALELAFVNIATGEENVVTKEFKVTKENLKKIANLVKPRRRRLKASTFKCGVGFFFRHIPTTGETSLVDLFKKKFKFGTTKNQQIFTTGIATMRKDRRSCFQINNGVSKKDQLTRKSWGCFNYGEMLSKQCNKRKSP